MKPTPDKYTYRLWDKATGTIYEDNINMMDIVLSEQIGESLEVKLEKAVNSMNFHHKFFEEKV